ncbi:hypothetical protein O9992_15145 [Vibrio lentus]|nr:hypothetical protein [Vibrio lentus]
MLHEGKDKLGEVIDQLLGGNDQMMPKAFPSFEWDSRKTDSIIEPRAMCYLRYYYQSRDILDKEFAASENGANRA